MAETFECWIGTKSRHANGNICRSPKTTFQGISADSSQSQTSPSNISVRPYYSVVGNIEGENVCAGLLPAGGCYPFHKSSKRI